MNLKMHVPSMSAVVSRWFTSYGAARASLESQGGYLFSHQNHFFVTEREGVRELGMDPDDPDWERIGWDWSRPVDLEAWRRLCRRRLLVDVPGLGGPAARNGSRG